MVELVAAHIVRPLRRAVLRPGRAEDESAYPADDDPDTAHVAARTGRLDDSGPADSSPVPSTESVEVIAVGTVLREAPPWEPTRSDGWRVRGMATRPDARRRGVGGTILEALLDHVAAQGGGLVWCNARVAALRLYQRAGFAIRGPEFDLPGIGPHHHMWRTVDGDADRTASS